MAPTFFSRHGHHSGTIVGILVIIIAIWFLHSTGIFMYVLALGIVCVLVAVGIHFYKRRQMMIEGGEYGELPSSSTPLRQGDNGYSGFGGAHHNEPAHVEPYQAQASSGYPPAYQNYVPTPQSEGGVPYQASGNPSYDAQSTPYVPPAGNRAYSYNV
jgi:hypothetical protein